MGAEALLTNDPLLLRKRMPVGTWGIDEDGYDLTRHGSGQADPASGQHGVSPLRPVRP